LATTDLALSIFFLIFVAVFVLIGLIPFFQEISAALRKFLATAEEGGKGREDVLRGEGVDSAREGGESAPIYGLEVMALRGLARAGRKGISFKAMAADLNLSPATVKKTLESLGTKRLARYVRPFPFGRHYYLSGRGRDYAAVLGFFPRRLRR